QRSERKRAAVMLAGLGVLLAVMVIRNLTGGAVQQGLTFVLTGATLLAMMAFEVGVLEAVRIADRRSTLLPPLFWTVVTVIESVTPPVLIAIVLAFSSARPAEAVTPPSLLAYGLVLVLSVMHLRPGLSVLAALVAAAGHLGVVVAAGMHAGAAGEPFSWPTML